MVKSIISMAVVLVLIVFGAIGEHIFVNKQFTDMSYKTQEVYQKIESENATEEDVYSLQDEWLKKKKYLHIFIPHNEIKEVDLWLSESIKLVKDEKWMDALSKMEVLKELLEQIPLTFNVYVENIL